jgi:hypothetical protein
MPCRVYEVIENQISTPLFHNSVIRAEILGAYLLYLLLTCLGELGDFSEIRTRLILGSSLSLNL